MHEELFCEIPPKYQLPRFENNFKNHKKICRKRQKIVHNFLKMRIFFVKWAKYSHFEKIGANSTVGADSTVLTVLETLTNIDFQVGIPTFKNETKTRQLIILGYFPRFHA